MLLYIYISLFQLGEYSFLLFTPKLGKRRSLFAVPMNKIRKKLINILMNNAVKISEVFTADWFKDQNLKFPKPIIKKRLNKN